MELWELASVARAWRRMACGGEVSSQVPGVREEIVESWIRSHRAGVDPYGRPSSSTGQAVRSSKLEGRGQALLEAGVLELLRLERQFSGQEIVVILADAQQRVVEAHYCGERSAVWELARELAGVNLAEERSGTNCVGLAFRLRRPTEVRFYEHYARYLHRWAAIAAPVFHPERKKEVVGALAVMAFRKPLPKQAVSLLGEAAGFVQQRLSRLDALGEALVLEEFARCQARFPDRVIVALSAQGKVLALSSSATKRLSEAVASRTIGASIGSWQALRLEGGFPPKGKHTPSEVVLHLKGRDGDAVFSGTAYPVLNGADAESEAGFVIVAAQATSQKKSKSGESCWRALYGIHDFVGRSRPVMKVLELARKVAAYDWPVLLVGESGTGKELLASAIHSLSPRASGPFVALDCSAIPQELIASELFGYEEGAFSGARRGGKLGKIELSHGGTLFLDELADLPLNVQAALLRFLEDKRIVPLGAQQAKEVDVRVIAAINLQPALATAQNKLRFDLYQRLNVFQITLPPLRERLDDIPLLVEHLLQQSGLGQIRVSPQTWEVLKRHPWPGNVRELRNVILRAALSARDGVIEPSDLVFDTPPARPEPQPPASHRARRLSKEQILLALEQCGWNKSHAAKRLGVHWVTLYRALKRWGLERTPTGAEPASSDGREYETGPGFHSLRQHLSIAVPEPVSELVERRKPETSN